MGSGPHVIISMAARANTFLKDRRCAPRQGAVKEARPSHYVRDRAAPPAASWGHSGGGGGGPPALLHDDRLETQGGGFDRLDPIFAARLAEGQSAIYSPGARGRASNAVPRHSTARAFYIHAGFPRWRPGHFRKDGSTTASRGTGPDAGPYAEGFDILKNAKYRRAAAPAGPRFDLDIFFFGRHRRGCGAGAAAWIAWLGSDLAASADRQNPNAGGPIPDSLERFRAEQAAGPFKRPQSDEAGAGTEVASDGGLSDAFASRQNKHNFRRR